MSANERAPVDVATITAAYTLGLDVWGNCPTRGKPLEALLGQLEGHSRLLMREVEEKAARLRGPERLIAVHVLRRTHQTLEDGPRRHPGAHQFYAQDLAVVVRALLALHVKPGPLVEPYGAEEIRAEVTARICGACSRPIADGQRCTRRVYPADSTDVNGWVHADPCVTARVRRPELRPVPPRGCRP